MTRTFFTNTDAIAAVMFWHHVGEAPQGEDLVLCRDAAQFVVNHPFRFEAWLVKIAQELIHD